MQHSRDTSLRERSTLCSMNLNDLQSLLRAIELGSVSAAAREADVPRSTISRRITRLEDELGVELIRRGARKLAPTADGQRLFALANGPLRDLKSAERALLDTASEPQGTLVITAPDLARSEPFAELIAAYRARHPQVRVDLRVDNRVLDLVNDGVDIGLRGYVRQIPGSADSVAKLFELPHLAFYTSPAYAARRGLPTELSAVAEHDLVLHRASATVPKPMTRGDERQELRLPTPAVLADDSQMLAKLVMAGLGIGLLNTMVAQEAVAAGQLVPVLPEWQLRVGRIAAVWPATRHLAPRVRAFVDLLGEYFRPVT